MNKTIKELSAEIGVSEQALRQWCKKNNVRKERTQGTKPSYIIDFDTEKQIKEYYSCESNERKAESNETKERNERKESCETCESTPKEPEPDFQNIYIDALKIQIEDLKSHIETLKEQLTVKDTQINVLTGEIEQDRKERQTLLLELVDLRGRTKLTTAAAAPETKAAPEPHPQKPRQQSQQPPKKRTLSERIRDFFK